MLSFFRPVLLLTAWIFSISAYSVEQDSASALKVYLLLGQSNMIGMRSKVDELPDSLKNGVANSYFYQKGKWLNLKPGQYQEKGFGPEISFAQEIRKSGNHIGIIKIAEGDTALYDEWYPQAGRLYKETLRVVTEARKSRPITIAGILWMQGESDSEYKSMALDYEKDFAKLIQVLRSDLGTPNTPFIACTISAPRADYPYAGLVEQAQKKINVKGYKYIDCSGLTKGPDNLHYDTSGQVEMGKLFAEALTK